jgi:hypothetical protein
MDIIQDAFVHVASGSLLVDHADYMPVREHARLLLDTRIFLSPKEVCLKVTCVGSFEGYHWISLLGLLAMLKTLRLVGRSLVLNITPTHSFHFFFSTLICSSVVSQWFAKVGPPATNSAFRCR